MSEELVCFYCKEEVEGVYQIINGIVDEMIWCCECIRDEY